MKADELKNKQEKLLEQWNSFVDYGIIIDHVNPIVAQSWIRSKSYGVNPRNPKVTHLSKDELEELCQKNKNLIQCAKPLMDKLLALSKDTADLMSLHDKNGYMLAFVEQQENEKTWRESIFRPGVKWAEEDVGTNGIGLALAIDQPVQLFGSEHYCYLQRRCVCYAAPIHDTEGNVIGALNMSGPLTSENPYLLTLVTYGAYSIENQLNLNQSYGYIDKMMDAISEGLLLFNSQFEIMRCSTHAAKIFKTKTSALIGENVKVLLNMPDLAERLRNTDSSVFLKEQTCRYGERTVSCSVEITPILDHGGVNGGVALLRESQNMNKIANIYSGNYSRYTFTDIISCDDQIAAIKENMKAAAVTDGSILIEGESGTGKELFAHAIHSYSPRKKEPFIAINCASLPHSLVESELFGYEKGSFSGALSSGNPGKFELANGGTIFLDEIGELPLEIQSKLLRVLDTHRVIRIGGKTEKELDIRIIAATNRNLLERVHQQEFRGDLYYRLNVFKFDIPPLRDRKNDLEPLINSFVAKQNLKENVPPKKASIEFLQALKQHSWPGNVRELQNVVVRSFYNCEGQEIRPEHIGGALISQISAKMKTEPKEVIQAPHPAAHPEKPLDDKFQEERERLLELIASQGGDLQKTAQILGISRATMYRRLNKYHINSKWL